MKRTTTTSIFGAGALTVTAALALAQNPAPPAAPAATSTKVTKVVAVLRPTQGSTVEGTIAFTRGTGGVAVSGKISGLTPGLHGFHVHEFGDCTAADATSAGSHFNPGGHPHAAPEAPQRHLGDLGNVAAGSDGTAVVDVKDSQLSLEGPTSIVGRGLIVHAKADDLKTQPTGDAGGRLACAVIGVAKGQ